MFLPLIYSLPETRTDTGFLLFVFYVFFEMHGLRVVSVCIKHELLTLGRSSVKF